MVIRLCMKWTSTVVGMQTALFVQKCISFLDLYIKYHTWSGGSNRNSCIAVLESGSPRSCYQQVLMLSVFIMADLNKKLYCCNLVVRIWLEDSFFPFVSTLFYPLFKYFLIWVIILWASTRPHCSEYCESLQKDKGIHKCSKPHSVPFS